MKEFFNLYSILVVLFLFVVLVFFGDEIIDEGLYFESMATLLLSILSLYEGHTKETTIVLSNVIVFLSMHSVLVAMYFSSRISDKDFKLAVKISKVNQNDLVSSIFYRFVILVFFLVVLFYFPIEKSPNNIIGYIYLISELALWYLWFNSLSVLIFSVFNIKRLKIGL